MAATSVTRRRHGIENKPPQNGQLTGPGRDTTPIRHGQIMAKLLIITQIMVQLLIMTRRSQSDVRCSRTPPAPSAGVHWERWCAPADYALVRNPPRRGTAARVKAGSTVS